MTNRKPNDKKNRQTNDRNAKREFSKGKSMGEEPRENLSENVPPTNLAEAIRAHFAPLGGVELEIPPRGPMREPPDFE